MITESIFDGLKAVKVDTGKVKMYIITACGPRIAFLGTNEEDNILYWAKDAVSRENWQLHGGHRVWITRPYADEAEDAYMEDNDECYYEISENRVIVTSKPHPYFKISRGMDIEILSDTKLRVTNFIKNDGGLIYSGGVWSPTCINPEGKKIIVELGQGDVTWDLVKIVIPRKFAGNTVLINDPQISFTEEQMIVEPKGIVTKRCLCAPQGKLTTTWEEKGLSFVKTSKYKPNAKYPLDGCNVAVFVGENNWMAEMETFGEEQPVIPGQTIYNEEIWEIISE